MERRIDPDALLDYVELQIFPSHNRYEACVSTSNIIEKAATGDLQQLLLHLPQVKDLSSKTNDSNFRILTPDNVSNADWFTTVTLTRFLNIAGSPDILSIGNEISQLEETRKFQLSLFAKAEVDMTSSFESKNELLRAVDSRLSELKQKLGEALNQATGVTCSPKDLSNLENFAHHFGAEDIRDSLQKFLESSQFPSSKTPEKTVFATNPPVKYGVSPAKAAEVERQSLTESENSFSSEEEKEEDQTAIERSRPVARSATPRRLASPMRRVQIGRAGPRRAATISIKSLNYFPNREKLSTNKDATCHASDEEEESETPVKQNALRMSVQDKISLFENKQKEKAVETEKSKTVLTAPVAKKAVLRRWSSGMSEPAGTQIQNDTINKSLSSSNHDDGAPAGNTESLTSQSSETVKNVKSSPPKADILNLEMENSEDESEEINEINEINEKHPASIEWNQQKEAELNQLFKKMMESKPVRRHSVTNDNSKSKNNNPKEQRGGFYDHYKQKRDEKLRKEASGKKAEKESQFKEMEKFLDEKKAEMASTNVTDSRKKPIVNKIKPQNSQKNPTQLPNTKKEASKVPIAKKSSTLATNKLSPLPATRKSWPATPSPRPTATSPAKTPSGPASTNASLTRKPQTTSSSVRSNTKVEKSKSQPKTLKSTQPDANKNIKTMKEKKQPAVSKVAPIAKSKSRTPAATPTAAATVAATAAKPSFYNKVTKKSSVVPLETKPFLRKGTGIGPGVGPVVVKSKAVAQLEEEQPDDTGDMIQSENNDNQVVEVEVEATEITSQSQSQNRETECEPAESETQLLTPVKCEEPEGFIHSRIKKEIEEESTISISPTAWVEIEENNNNNNNDNDNNGQGEIVPCKESPIQATKRGAPGGGSSPRVRHSLFQMLLEETTSEADSCEWGNAQQPPAAMVNQKDGPKGFKRLLKFARKSKADLNLSDGSSPSSIFRRG